MIVVFFGYRKYVNEFVILKKKHQIGKGLKKQ